MYLTQTATIDKTAGVWSNAFNVDEDLLCLAIFDHLLWVDP